jgi:hypothetical protein
LIDNSRCRHAKLQATSALTKIIALQIEQTRTNRTAVKMSGKTEKADAIKSYAINGRFGEIETKFGAKAAHKGREYVRND